MMDGAKTSRDRESLKQTVRVNKSQISIEIYMSKFTLTYVYVHICVRITESFRANGFPKSSTPTWDGRSRRQSIKACINVFEKPTQVIWKINIWHPDDAATIFTRSLKLRESLLGIYSTPLLLPSFIGAAMGWPWKVRFGNILLPFSKIALCPVFVCVSCSCCYLSIEVDKRLLASAGA